MSPKWQNRCLQSYEGMRADVGIMLYTLKNYFKLNKGLGKAIMTFLGGEKFE